MTTENSRADVDVDKLRELAQTVQIPGAGVLPLYRVRQLAGGYEALLDRVEKLVAELDQARTENAEWREQAAQETAEWGAETLSPIEDRLMEALQPRLDETDAAWVVQEHLLPLLKTVASFRKDDLTFYTANEALGAEVVRLRGLITDTHKRIVNTVDPVASSFAVKEACLSITRAALAASVSGHQEITK